MPQEFPIRRAVPADVEPLRELIRESVVGLGGSDYSAKQLASALTHLFGVDTRLIDACERAARAEGFRRMELMATLTGIPLYERGGFVAKERVELVLPDGVRFPLVRMERPLSRNALQGA